MLRVLTLLVVVYGTHQATAAISPPTITAMTPQGIRFSTPDAPGISLVSFHYSVNSPDAGVAAGQYNEDIHAATGNEWKLENPSLTLNPGDKVNYWVFVIKNGRGEQLTDQSWTVPVPTATPSPTARPPVTTAQPTTRPPVTTAQPTTRPPVTTAQPTTHAPIVNNNNNNNNHTDNMNTNMGSTSVAPNLVDTMATDTATNTGTGTGTGSGTSSGTGTGTCSCDQTMQSGSPNVKKTACTSYPCLVFEDEFDTLDLDVWEHEISMGGGGNWEFQYYTNNRSNSYVRDGVLYIKPTLTTEFLGPNGLTKGALDIWGSQPGDVCTGNAFWGCRRDGNPDHIINPIQSARLRSSRGFNFKYGKVELEAKMPNGDWLWPAIWLLPLRNRYGQWPASGEIDIVEVRGNAQLTDDKGNEQGIRNMGSTLHFGSDFFHNKWPSAHGEKAATSGTYGDSFHKYTLIWDEDHISISVDDVEVLNVTPPQTMWEYGGNDQDGVDSPWKSGSKMAPFDQEFFLIMNVAAGGTAFFPETLHNGGPPKPWSDTSEFAPRDFWNGRASWLPTWNLDKNNGEDAAMQVKYVRVWKLKP